MLFTYRNHPILQKLRDCKLGTVAVDERDVKSLQPQLEKAANLFRVVCPNFKNNVRVVSEKFSDSMYIARDTLMKNEELWAEILLEQSAGVIIIKDVAICYNITPDLIMPNGDKEPVVSVSIFAFQRDRLTVFGHLFIGTDADICYVNRTLLKDGKTPKQHLNGLVGDVILYLNFVRYANVETKYVGANKKVKDFHGKYCNQTDIPVTMLDSKWFTNIVKTEGFAVRGHFRWQRFGPQLKEKKLIWIDDFQKNGYTSTAKVLTNVPLKTD